VSNILNFPINDVNYITGNKDKGEPLIVGVKCKDISLQLDSDLKGVMVGDIRISMNELLAFTLAVTDLQPYQDDYEFYDAVPLKIFIAQRHNGNITAFAKTQGVRYDQVGRWLKRNCVVIDGTVYCEVSKKTSKP
jgi:hypothetical protein